MREYTALFMQPKKISKSLGKVIGFKDKPRTECIKRIWKYIKKHNLQNPKNRRNILCDKILEEIFGKKEITMFELTKLIQKHIT